MMRCKFGRFTYDEMNDQLVKEFPNLTPRYEQELDWWGDEKPGPHIVYGDLFVPYLAKCLKTGDSKAAKKAFKHLEMVLKHEDVKVQEVAVVTVLEAIENDEELLALARPFFGPLAAKAIDDLKKFWERIRS